MLQQYLTYTIIMLYSCSLSSTNTVISFQSAHEHYHREKQTSEQLHQECVSLLSVLGVGGCAMEKVPLDLYSYSGS